MILMGFHLQSSKYDIPRRRLPWLGRELGNKPSACAATDRANTNNSPVGYGAKINTKQNTLEAELERCFKT
jgi:hypothetical protein